ncbi:MAG TPA: hypothetical protein VFP84_03050 [Kofleriaceae bacterium]|nr:hypothetical protein [Kofleriaceae bacterium]
MSSVVSAVVSGLVLLSACASAPGEGDDAQVSTAQDRVTVVRAEPPTVQPFPRTEPITSTWWAPGRLTYADIWPLDHGITSAQIVYRKEIDSSIGPTHVAFVVWNGSFVGRIYRIHNNADSTDFLLNVAQLEATRVSRGPDNSVSSSGNGTGGNTKPPPHPNVDEDITYNPDDLDNARVAGRALLNVTTRFIGFQTTATPATR